MVNARKPEIDTAKGARQQLREALLAERGVLWVVLPDQEQWVDVKHTYRARRSRECGIHVPLRRQPPGAELQKDKLVVFGRARLQKSVENLLRVPKERKVLRRHP